jgi:NAD(P)-dependent dehydrogenase (short-subunit alcohol dehydrogenase family)
LRAAQGEETVKGKVVLVTGATFGIGQATALQIARMGATVIVAGRNEAKSQAVVHSLRQETGNPNVDYLLADLSSISQTTALAQEFQARYDRLDVLINNVGVFLWRRHETVDGLEHTFALNHLVGYFLLTRLLLDRLRASAPSRIVSVSSDAHFGGKIHFDDLQGQRRFSGWKAYSQSKLANVLFTYALARRLEGSGVTANTLHPGVVASGFPVPDNTPDVLARGFLKLYGLVARSPSEGAETSVYLATAPEVEGVTGRYFAEKQPKESAEISYDQAIQERLWRVSEQLLAERAPGGLSVPVAEPATLEFAT